MENGIVIARDPPFDKEVKMVTVHLFCQRLEIKKEDEEHRMD